MHRNIPANNADWWSEKISENKQRDAETSELLKAEGWKVLRFWEHENEFIVLAAVREVFERYQQT